MPVRPLYPDMSRRTGVAVAAMSDRGQRRARNEDAVLGQVWTVPGHDEPIVVLAVADGMGGSHGGEIASAVALSTAQRELRTQVETGRIEAGHRDAGLGPDDAAWLGALRAAFTAVTAALRARAIAEPELIRMGTTLTCLILDRGRIVFGHVGDSRALLFRDGVLRQLTRDHNAAADLVASGRLHPDEAATHRSRFVLTRWLPPVDPDPEPPEVGSLAAVAGDVLMVCSDGLHALVRSDDLAAVLSTASGVDEPLDATAARLVTAANGNGGTDNISVALAAIDRHA
jgi:PPM family protein phosphatase